MLPPGEMTFFPMLVNALAGLSASGHMERDLMRSYGADHRQMQGDDQACQGQDPTLTSILSGAIEGIGALWNI